MNKEILLRPVHLHEYKTVWRLQKQSTGAPWTLEGVQEMFKDPSIQCFGAECFGGLVGFMMVRVVADQGDIIEFVVDSLHRRQRIGEKIYQFVEINCLKNKLKIFF